MSRTSSIAILLALLSLCVNRFPQEKQESQDEIHPFSVAVEELNLWSFGNTETITANGQTYFIAAQPPKSIQAAIIIAEGDHQPWIVVRKLAGGKSVKLKPSADGSFLFESQGPGEYEVTSLDPKNEPVFSYFVLESSDPGPGPGNPPTGPPKDVDTLITAVAAAKPTDVATMKRLGEEWKKVLAARPATLDDAKRNFGKSRAALLETVRDQDGTTNKFLLVVDEWFRARQWTLETWSAAMTALTNWMVR